MPKSKQENRAFSLTELIISIGVLSIGIVAITQAYSFSARVAGLSCDIIKASFLGEDIMQEMEFKEKRLLIKDAPLSRAAFAGKFHWEMLLNFQEALNLYKLDFNIKWINANRQENIDVGTYLR